MTVDQEFKKLIPPLSKEEYEQLEQNCLKDGIRESLVVWDNNGEWILVDGHNRYEIAVKHNLPYNQRRMEFKDREEVIRWIILNQFGRRNLSAYDRSILALRLKPIIQEKAKENLSEGGKGCQISDKVDTKKELAKVAGVSHDTIHKVEVIQTKAPERIKKLVQEGEISINQGFHETMNIIKPTPKPIEKQAKERHEEVKKADVVSISEIKADNHDQAIIGLGIVKDLIRLEKEVTGIAEDEDMKCCIKLDKEDLRDAIRTCNKILHGVESIRRELTQFYGK